MRAAWRDRYGPPEVVEVREIDRPVPTGDQVLVKVRAASVNRADLDGLYPRWQFVRLIYGIRAPRVHRVGIDVAGTVEDVGSEVTLFKPGDDVFADLFSFNGGTFAEYVCDAETAFQPMARGMSHEDASTLPHAAVLALQALRTRDGRLVQAGQRVMIVGASGNVGPFAVQIAKSRGAEVTGVARTDKLDFVRSLGADHVVDYTTTDYTRMAERFDWIVDVDAHHSVLRWRGMVRSKGVYAALGGSGAWMVTSLLEGPALSLASGKKMGLMLTWKPFKVEDVDTLKELYAAGHIKPAIDRRFALDDVVQALRWVDDGRARGKVVITP
jgi:NADPH:quinone reductase-like Zn-dependent oxidoreductase